MPSLLLLLLLLLLFLLPFVLLLLFVVHGFDALAHFLSYTLLPSGRFAMHADSLLCHHIDRRSQIKRLKSQLTRPSHPPSHPLTSFSARLERDGRSRPRQSSGPRRRGARPHTVARIDIIKSFGHSGVKRLRTDDAAHRDSAAAVAVAAAPPLLCARLHEVS